MGAIKAPGKPERTAKRGSADMSPIKTASCHATTDETIERPPGKASAMVGCPLSRVHHAVSSAS